MYVCLEVCMLVYGLHTIWPCEGAFKMWANIHTATNRGQAFWSWTAVALG